MHSLVAEPAGSSCSNKARLTDFSINALLCHRQSSGEYGTLTNNEVEFRPIDCQLESFELWYQFSRIGTEMIITKLGRRMFPVLTVTLSRLQPGIEYDVTIDMVPVDGLRYRYSYHRSRWLPTATGRVETNGIETEPITSQPTTPYRHPSSPLSCLRPEDLALDGEMEWRSLTTQTLSFDRLKLTNCCSSANSQSIILHSMTKYQPRIHVRQQRAGDENRSKRQYYLQTFIFTETAFMAVTAYQNQLVTNLKIEFNPFAKGFRRLWLERKRNKSVLVNCKDDRKSSANDGNDMSCFSFKL